MGQPECERHLVNKQMTRENNMQQLKSSKTAALVMGLLLLAIIALGVTFSSAQAQQGNVILTGNQVVTAICQGRRLQTTRISDTEIRLTCLPNLATATPRPATATPIPPTATVNSPTATPNPPTATPVLPTATVIPPTGTATAHPSATATAQPGPTSTPVAAPNQPCPEWAHNRHVTTGPDGQSYPTWHPPVDPLYGCYFTHDHGVDPRTSSVNGTLPAFGYVGTQGGFAEPHAGFKVFVFECGESGDQGANRIAARFVMHMGTSGVMRYHMPFHSVHYSARACDGSWEIDIMGMADFGAAIGSICGPRTGRDFSTLGCVSAGNPQDAYEIWTGTLQINHPNDPYIGLFQSRAYVVLSPAVFDPVTTVNPNDIHQIIYTSDIVYPGQYNPLSAQSPFRGCKMEAYHGPVSLNNAGRPQTYVTDVFGNIIPGAQPGTAGTLTQIISSVRVDGSNSNASVNGTQFKKVFDQCNPYIVPPN